MRDINKDIIKYAPAKIVGMLMNLAVVPIYTSLLIPEQYGLYNVTIGFLSLIAIIFSDWVGLSALRFFKEYFKTDNVKDFFNSILFILISNLLLMYILVFFIFDFIKEQFKLPQEHIVLVLVLIIPVAFRALMFQLLRAQIKPGTYSIITIFNQLATIALSIMFIKYFNLESKGILWGMLVSITIVDLILLVLSKLSFSSEIKKIDVRDLGGFYRYGVPIALSSFGLWAITQSNKFVIQYFKGSEFNGYIGVGYNVTFSLLFPLFGILTLAGIPRIINKYEEGHEVRTVMTRLSEYFFMVFTPVVFLMCCFPEQLVLLLSNQKYVASTVLVPFLALSAFLYGITEYCVIQYHLAKKTHIEMALKISSNFFGILLTILLIKVMSDKNILLAVGISALVSQMLYLGLTFIIRIKDLCWNPPFSLLKKIVIAILISSLALLVGNSVLLQAIMFIIAYIIILYLLNSILNKTIVRS